MKRFYHNTANRTVRAESIECSTTGQGKTAQHKFFRSRTDVSADGGRSGGSDISPAYGFPDTQAKAQELYELHHGTKDKEGWVEINADAFDALSKEYADAYAAAQKESAKRD